MATDTASAKRLSWAIPGWLQAMLAIGLAAGAFILLALGLARTGSPVTIDLDGQRLLVRTHAMTVG